MDQKRSSKYNIFVHEETEKLKTFRPDIKGNERYKIVLEKWKNHKEEEMNKLTNEFLTVKLEKGQTTLTSFIKPKAPDFYDAIRELFV